MNRTYSLGLASIALLALVGAGCSTVPVEETNDAAEGDAMEQTEAVFPAEGEPIKLGWVGPLTGDAAVYGDPIQKSAALAVEEINAAGGINGHMLEIVYEDGKCNGKDAAGAVQKLLSSDKVQYVLGGTCSGETLAMAPITEQNEVLLLSAASTNPDISDAGDFVFRNAPADDAAGIALAKVISENGYKKVALISETTDFTEGIAQVFTKQFPEVGGEVVLSERFDSDTRDFRTIITKIKSSGADAVLINTQTTATGGPFLKQLRELEVAVPAYANNTLSAVEILSIAGEGAKGLSIVDVPGLSEENKIAKKYLAAFNEKHGTAPQFAFFSGGTYDGVHILAEAFAAVGTDTSAVRDYMYAIDAYDGVIGTYGFDEHGDLVGLDYVIKQFQDGELVTL